MEIGDKYRVTFTRRDEYGTRSVGFAGYRSTLSGALAYAERNARELSSDAKQGAAIDALIEARLWHSSDLRNVVRDGGWLRLRELRVIAPDVPPEHAEHADAVVAASQLRRDAARLSDRAGALIAGATIDPLAFEPKVQS